VGGGGGGNGVWGSWAVVRLVYGWVCLDTGKVASDGHCGETQQPAHGQPFFISCGAFIFPRESLGQRVRESVSA
jgi:hypothetical protein